MPGCPCHHLSAHLAPCGSADQGPGLCEDSATLPGTLPTHRELLLVLPDKRGHREAQRRWPSMKGRRRLAFRNSRLLWNGRQKNYFGVAGSICAEGKEGVGRGGNGNRCSFNV